MTDIKELMVEDIYTKFHQNLIYIYNSVNNKFGRGNYKVILGGSSAILLMCNAFSINKNEITEIISRDVNLFYNIENLNNTLNPDKIKIPGLGVYSINPNQKNEKSASYSITGKYIPEDLIFFRKIRIGIEKYKNINTFEIYGIRIVDPRELIKFYNDDLGEIDEIKEKNKIKREILTKIINIIDMSGSFN